MSRLAIPLATASILLATCSEGSDGSVDVQPIDAILASDIAITVDASGTTATLAVDTTIPVACSVIYGTDDTFGSIAVDNDMQGGAHHDHSPLLVGLQPDTDYHYILQGSDAAGTLYRSETFTFRTPPVTAGAFGENIAPNGTVSAASSEFSADFAATNAIDGNLGTEWSTAGDGDGAYIEIDLGRSVRVTAVAFRTRQMTDGTAITNTFTVTIEGRRYGPYPTGAEPAVLDTPTAARTLRVEADQTTGGNTGATEIEIYGEP